MAPVFVILVSPLFFAESLTGRKIFCAVLAVIGMYFVSGLPVTGFNGAGELKGIEYDRRPAEMQLYADNIPQKHYPDGRWTIAESGIPVSADASPEGTDIHAVLNGYVSVGKIFTGLMRS